MSDYSDIYGYVRGLLRKTEEELPDTDTTLMLQTSIELPGMLAQVPCLTGGSLNYDDVPATGNDNDKNLFDLAVAHAVAAALLGDDISANAGANDGAGAILEEEVGPVRTKYAGLGSTKDILRATITGWQEKPAKLLSLISCVKKAKMAGPAKGQGSKIVGLAGYGRGEELSGNRRPCQVPSRRWR